MKGAKKGGREGDERKKTKEEAKERWRGIRE